MSIVLAVIGLLFGVASAIYAFTGFPTTISPTVDIYDIFKQVILTARNICLLFAVSMVFYGLAFISNKYE